MKPTRQTKTLREGSEMLPEDVYSQYKNGEIDEDEAIDLLIGKCGFDGEDAQDFLGEIEGPEPLKEFNLSDVPEEKRWKEEDDPEYFKMLRKSGRAARRRDKFFDIVDTVIPGVTIPNALRKVYREGGHRVQLPGEVRDQFIHHILLIKDPQKRRDEMAKIQKAVYDANVKEYLKKNPDATKAEAEADENTKQKDAISPPLKGTLNESSIGQPFKNGGAGMKDMHERNKESYGLKESEGVFSKDRKDRDTSDEVARMESDIRAFYDYKLDARIFSGDVPGKGEQWVVMISNDDDESVTETGSNPYEAVANWRENKGAIAKQLLRESAPKHIVEGAGAQITLNISDYELEYDKDTGDVVLLADDVVMDDYYDSISSKEDGYGDYPFYVGKLKGLTEEDMDLVVFDDDIGNGDLKISEGFGSVSPSSLPTFKLGVYFDGESEKNELGEVELVCSETMNYMYQDLKDKGSEELEESKGKLSEGRIKDMIFEKVEGARNDVEAAMDYEFDDDVWYEDVESALWDYYMHERSKDDTIEIILASAGYDMTDDFDPKLLERIGMALGSPAGE